MNYELVIFWISIGTIIVFGLSIVLSSHYIFYIYYGCINHPKFKKTDKRFTYGILIPARNESRVIAHILDSLKKQTYNSDYFDVYVIVENKNDPTVKIVESYGYNVVVRENLDNRRTKGFALDDAIQYIKKIGKHYDAYMIFDADNILDSRFISKMNRVKASGYQVGLGYRNSTNATETWVSGCSSVLFAIMNCFGSKARAHYIQKVTLSGTGYFIDSEIIDKEGGFIWNGLTEDVELTSYTYLHDIKCAYYERAIYYDEQPSTMRVCHRQHIRWIGGFIKSGKVYNKPMIKEFINDRNTNPLVFYDSLMGVWPIVLFVVADILYFLTMIVFSIMGALDGSGAGFLCFWAALISLFVLIIPFIFITFLISFVERKSLNFTFGFTWLVAFMFFFYFIDFVPAFFASLQKKNQGWDVISHSGKITSDSVKSEIHK
jgi:cellulose synthase/poly-beta-1,6-N-acetylglucosamine synthase-like glycosyltransferase